MSNPPASTRFSEQPALNRSSRVAVLTLLVLVYMVIGLVVWASGVVNDGLLSRQPDLQAISIPLDSPPPPASPASTPAPAGAEGAAAKAAKPTPVVAAPAKIPNKAMTAAPAASTGDAAKSGASGAGAGTGGGSVGSGTGSSGSGDGAGSGSGASRAVKIADDITATRDYPARTRNLRLGSSVVVVLTVGTDGRVRACRVHKPSPDSEADAITCRLATQRFRFRPAIDRAGNPIESDYGWQQSFFVPGTKLPGGL